MKCFFCDAEILDGKDKCDYCGRFQHEKNTAQVLPVQNNQMNQPKKIKKSEIGAMIFKSIIVITLIAVCGYFIYKYLSSRKDFYGEWLCNNGDLVVTIDENHFITNYESGGYEKADYTLIKEEKSEISTKYYLNVSDVKTLINGQQRENTYDTSFEIVIEESKKDEFILSNRTTDKVYSCLKKY